MPGLPKPCEAPRWIEGSSASSVGLQWGSFMRSLPMVEWPPVKRRPWHDAGARGPREKVMNPESTVTFKCEGCGVRKPEAERYRPRSAFTVCSQACLDTAIEKKAQAMHARSRR